MIDKGAGTAAFDDASVVVGGNLYWSGALRFAVGAGAFAGGYDANGNMTVRVVDGKGQILSYDAENRLVQVQDSVNTDNFVYDGDGNRVKTDVNNVVTYYVGSHFEWTGSTTTMVKYYSAGGSRVAMRVGSSTRYYLLSDHLGGTNVTVTALGTEYGEVRYKAFGDTRFTSGTSAEYCRATTMRYTGQRQESSIGLYFYGARWYDSALGRFTSPDSIIPAQQGVMGWDRYAYTNNNPLRFTDPTGHSVDCTLGEDDCEESQDGKVSDDIDTTKETIGDTLTTIAGAADTISLAINMGQAAIIDFIGTLAIIAFTAIGPEGPTDGIVVAATLDYYMASSSPTGVIENLLGIVSSGATIGADIAYGNTDSTKIGVDSIVSVRNAVLGLIPEVNVDAAIGFNQFVYDMERYEGKISGGSVPFTIEAIFNTLLTAGWPAFDQK